MMRRNYGHSLGGALATIAASILKIQTFVYIWSQELGPKLVKYFDES